MAKDNLPKPNKIKIGNWVFPVAIIIFFVIFTIVNGDSNLNQPIPISFSKFNTLLEKGEVDKVIVYNNLEAEVYLTKTALKEQSNKGVAKNLFNQPNAGPHYTFDIGSAE